jgi:hypothetical protein
MKEYRIREKWCDVCRRKHWVVKIEDAWVDYIVLDGDSCKDMSWTLQDSWKSFECPGGVVMIWGEMGL